MSRRANKVSAEYRRRRRAGARPEATEAGRFRGRLILGIGLILAMAAGIIVAVWIIAEESPTSLRLQADEAAKRGRWEEALRGWREVNRIGGDVHSQLAEARAALALGRAAQAERALIGASRLGPMEADPWLIRLEILRMEGREFEAQEIGEQALESVRIGSRREVLRALTLALLAEPPHELARRTLQRWIDADPDDREAQVALFRRMTNRPRTDDPTATERAELLESLLQSDPEHVGTREVLLLTLAELGQPDRGRQWLESWPLDRRDARFERIKGRWALEYVGRPDLAVIALQRALSVMPQDGRSRYRLARALQQLGRSDVARQVAEGLGRLRELLDPSRLGPRFDANLANLDEPEACQDLADLCESAGLEWLARAWRQEAERPAEGPRPLVAPGPRLP